MNARLRKVSTKKGRKVDLFETRPSFSSSLRARTFLLVVAVVSIGLTALNIVHTPETCFKTSIPSLFPIAKEITTRHDGLPRVLAIYFPQFHREPINDKLWGENFTDWVSLRNSPIYNRAGFEIPRPTELGYYDLMDKETRKKQGELAKRYGVDGFIYHHYWFYDRSHPGPNLAAPLLKMLEDGYPDVPFALNWCSVGWVNTWMAKAVNSTATSETQETILQEQFFSPSEEEIQEHYNWLSQFFRHHDYIRIQNQPVMFLYRYEALALPLIQQLRNMAKKDGFDGIYWVVGRNAAPEEIFIPHNLTVEQEDAMKTVTNPIDQVGLDVVFNQSMTYPNPLPWLTTTYKIPQWCLKGKTREEAAPRTRQEITGLITAFDNTPRREFWKAFIYGADTPKRILDRFRWNLRTALYYSTCCQRQTGDRFIAINAWNEWAEGMVLEPSDTYGRGFLEAIRDVKQEFRNVGCAHL